MSETTGQKPTNPVNKKSGEYVFEDGEWWYIAKQDRMRRHAETQQARHNRRMWVDGKYIPQSHPLHKPGRYKGFTDAAFSSLENYERSLEGEVYIIYNPSFPGWVKVGMAIDSKDRLKQYQTGSPYRNYTLVASYTVENRREAESKVHLLLEDKHSRRGEWFYCTAPVAKDILNKYFNSVGEQIELF